MVQVASAGGAAAAGRGAGGVADLDEVAQGGTGPVPACFSQVAAGAGFLLSTWMLTRLTVSTPMVLIMVAYALFGIGLGMVNPAITNNAVAGMPLTQAGVAAAIASTSRQVGAALGVDQVREGGLRRRALRPVPSVSSGASQTRSECRRVWRR